MTLSNNTLMCSVGLVVFIPIGVYFLNKIYNSKPEPDDASPISDDDPNATREINKIPTLYKKTPVDAIADVDQSSITNIPVGNVISYEEKRKIPEANETSDSITKGEPVYGGKTRRNKRKSVHKKTAHRS